MKLKSRVIMYLLFGILLTTAGTSVTLSKYMSTVSGSTSVSIAAVALDGAPITFDVSGMSPVDNTRTYQFEVTNQNIESGFGVNRVFKGKVSEVDQSYSIMIDHSNNLPLTYEFQVVNVEDQTLGTKVDSTKVETLEDSENGFTTLTYDSGMLPFGADPTVHTYEIKVTWDDTEKDWYYYQEIDYIGIRVESEQMD